MAVHELCSLTKLSASLGKEKLLVQASTGNTSVKIGHTLWVKASRKWLADALNEDIFTPVDFAEARKYLSGELLQFSCNSGLKPSIETPMHYVLPHRVVIHVHSVAAVTWAVQKDSFSHLCERLNPLRWCWIDYVFSGAPLAAKMRSFLSASPDVFILGNHGLVIGADNCDDAKDLLDEVERRLAVPARQLPTFDIPEMQRLALSCDFRLPDAVLTHSLATDELSMRTVTAGILYPCQAIFLGDILPVVSDEKYISRFISDFRHRNGFRPPVVLVKGRGVLVPHDLTSEESEMLVGLAEVARRIESSAEIAYLSQNDVDLLFQKNLYGTLRSTSEMTAGSARRSFDRANSAAVGQYS